jgi:hypothetical protein
MTGRPEGGGWTGIGEDVGVFGLAVGTVIQAVVRAGCTRAGADAGGAVAAELKGGEGAVFFRTDLQLLVRVGTVANAQGAPAFLDKWAARTP